MQNNHTHFRSLSLSILFCAFILVVGYTAIVSRDQGYEELGKRSFADLNRYILSLQQKLDRYKDLPNLLATHSTVINVLINHDDALSVQDANQYLENVNDLVGAAEVYIMDVTGRTLAASNWLHPDSFVGQNYSFRPYFKEALNGKASRYFALGSVSNVRGYYFSHPVRDIQENIVGVIVVKIELNEIESDWSDPSLNILLTDEDGVIFISTREDWKFKTLSTLPSEKLERINRSLRYGSQPLEALDIVDRKDFDTDKELVMLLEGQRENNPALDGVEANEFLLLKRPMAAAGLDVVVLASTKEVQEKMLYNALASGIIFITLVLLVLFVSTRQRITRERAHFKRMETMALEASEQRVRAIIENTQAGLITLDEQGRIDTMNTMAEKLFDYGEAEAIKKTFSEFLMPASRSAFLRHIAMSANADREDLFIEAEGFRQDGSHFPIELTVGQMSYGDKKRFLVTIHDITQRKEYEAALQRAHDLLEHRVESRTADLTRANAKLTVEIEKHKNTQNELIQTAKLAVLGQMSAGINHELNQPLAAIRSYADNAKAFINLGKVETATSNMEQISGLTERMAKIIHPLKEFSRKTTGVSEKVCLQNVHDGAMSILYGRLSKVDASVIWPSNLDNYYVLGDTVRLEQVLVNLISNALQAMENMPVPKIEITLDKVADKVIMQVRDYGPGVPEEELDRVFEPFYTTKESGQGLGLGLSISYRIIDNMGGSLAVDNHEDGGAVFTLCLPALPQT